MAYTQEVIVCLVIVSVILIGFVLRLEMRLRKLLRGNRTENIEDSLALIELDLKSLKNFKKEISAYLETAEKRLSRSVQGVATVRFNPFKGTGEGGNQSFASSFISEKGDGLTLSSLYSRDRVSVFAKPVKNFKSEYDLTAEEKESLSKAREMISLSQK